MSHGLLLMLENIDRRKNEIVPVDPNLDAEILQDQQTGKLGMGPVLGLSP